MSIQTISTALSVLASLCWLGFVAYTVHDLRQHRATMERLGRACARQMGVPYTGKSCVELRDEAIQRRPTERAQSA